MKTRDKIELWIIILVWFLLIDISLLVGIEVWNSAFAGIILFLCIIGIIAIIIFFCLLMISIVACDISEENEY